MVIMLEQRMYLCLKDHNLHNTLLLSFFRNNSQETHSVILKLLIRRTSYRLICVCSYTILLETISRFQHQGLIFHTKKYREIFHINI